MWKIIQADAVEWLENYRGNHFNAVLADPPYGIAFMASAERTWDKFKSPQAFQSWVESWAKPLIQNALYPGAVCLFFGGTRTFHRLFCGLEDAGMEIGDTIAWIYGSGFSHRSLAIGKAIDRASGKRRQILGLRIDSNGRCRAAEPHGKTIYIRKGIYDEDERPATQIKAATAPATPEAARWEGYGSALKTAHEPIALCRASKNGMTYAELALTYGTGSLWIDGCRIGANEIITHGGGGQCGIALGWSGRDGRKAPTDRIPLNTIHQGRFPSNVLFSHLESDEDEVCDEYCPVRMLGEMSGESKNGKAINRNRSPIKSKTIYGDYSNMHHVNDLGYDSSGTAARFFYCAKASRSEREAGLIGKLPCIKCGQLNSTHHEEERRGKKHIVKCVRNDHPTVKPLKLTEYLARLLLPPELDEPRRILVLFSGTGSEMIGALDAGWDEVVGVEIDPHSIEIAKVRLEHWEAKLRAEGRQERLPLKGAQ